MNSGENLVLIMSHFFVCNTPTEKTKLQSFSFDGVSQINPQRKPAIRYCIFWHVHVLCVCGHLRLMVNFAHTQKLKNQVRN